MSVARIAHAELPACNRGPVDTDGARHLVLGDPVLLTKESPASRGWQLSPDLRPRQRIP